MWLSNLTFKNTTHKYYTHISTNSCYTFSIYTSVLHCCDLICDTYLFKLFIFCVEWNGSFGFSNSTRSRSSVDYLYIWKSRSIFFLEIIAKKNFLLLCCWPSSEYFESEMNYCEFVWLFYKKYWQEKILKLPLETLPLLSRPLIAIDDHYPKGIWFIPPWLFFFRWCFFYMTAEVSVLLIPAVPVCQSSIESPQCSFFPYCYAMYYSLASFLSGIRQRIELQTTILQLAHPSFWQQINKRSTRGQLYKSWVAFPLMTNYQNVFYSLAHNTYLTDGEVRATKRDITCRFLIGWFLSFVVVSCFLLIFLPPPHIYYI